jgi:hypothetical protein
MNLELLWRLRDLVSEPIARVVAAAQRAGAAVTAANRNIQNAFGHSGASANSLRSSIQQLVKYRDSLRIGVDTTEINRASRQISNLRRQLSSFEKQNGESGGGGMMSKFGLGGLARMAMPLAAGAGIAAGVGSFVGAGMDRSVIDAQFLQFTKSQETAQYLISSINKYADQTSFENQDLLKSGAFMTQFVKPKDVMENIKVLGDVTGGNYERFNNVLMGMKKVHDTGYMQGDEADIFAENLVPLKEYLAKVKKVPLSMIAGLQKDRKISYADVTAALKLMTSQGGIYEGNMEKMSKTSRGLWSTISGTVKTKFSEMSASLEPFYQKIFTFGIELVNKINPIFDALGRLGAAFMPVFSAFGSLLSIFGVTGTQSEMIAKVVGNLVQVIKFLAFYVNIAANLIKFFADTIASVPYAKYLIGAYAVVKVMKEMQVLFYVGELQAFISLLGAIPWAGAISGMAGFKLAWQELNVAFALTPIGAIITAIVALIAALYYAWENSETFREVMIKTGYGILSVWELVKSWFISAGEWITKMYNQFIAGQTMVYNFFIKSWEEIKAFMHGIFLALPAPVQTFINILVEGFGIMKDKVKAIWNGLKDDILGVIQAILMSTIGLPILILNKLGIADAFGKGFNSTDAARSVNDDQQVRSTDFKKPFLDKIAESQKLINDSYEKLFPKPSNLGKLSSATKIGQNAASGAGLTDSVAGATHKTVTININKLMETTNIFADKGEEAARQIRDIVLDTMNRALLSGDRLALD